MNRNRRDLTRRFLPKFFLLPYGTLPKAPEAGLPKRRAAGAGPGCRVYSGSSFLLYTSSSVPAVSAETTSAMGSAQ